jgi:hypothetical protein
MHFLLIDALFFHHLRACFPATLSISCFLSLLNCPLEFVFCIASASAASLGLHQEHRADMTGTTSSLLGGAKERGGSVTRREYNYNSTRIKRAREEGAQCRAIP